MPHASPETHTQPQNLVALYVDTCVELGRREMIPLKGQVARQAKVLLEDMPLERVTEVIVTFVKRRARTALQLPEIAVELERERSGPAEVKPSSRRAAAAFVKSGWPTGCRMTRGTNAAGHVFDPLGRDPIPYTDWPYPRPSFDQIAAALASQ